MRNAVVLIGAGLTLLMGANAQTSGREFFSVPSDATYFGGQIFANDPRFPRRCTYTLGTGPGYGYGPSLDGSFTAFYCGDSAQFPAGTTICSASAQLNQIPVIASTIVDTAQGDNGTGGTSSLQCGVIDCDTYSCDSGALPSYGYRSEASCSSGLVLALQRADVNDVPYSICTNSSGELTTACPDPPFSTAYAQTTDVTGSAGFSCFFTCDSGFTVDSAGTQCLLQASSGAMPPRSRRGIRRRKVLLPGF